MIVFEIVAGVALLLGWRIRLFSWLLLLLGQSSSPSLPATPICRERCANAAALATASSLQQARSFTKDLVLLFLIVFLFGVRDKIRTGASGSSFFSAAIFIGAAIFFLSFFNRHVLVHLLLLTVCPDKEKPIFPIS